MDESKIDPEEVKRLYEQGYSMREIAKMLNTTKGKIYHIFEKHGIEPRDHSEANSLYFVKLKEEKLSDFKEEARAILEDIVKNIPSRKIKYSPVKRFNLVLPITSISERDCTVTIVISDLHIGDANFLPDTYWSTIENLCQILEFIRENYNVKELFLVLNGDIVAGREVYKYQELNNLLQRGHWQVFMAEYILRKTLEKIETVSKKVDAIYLTKGTHESLAENYVLYVKRLVEDRAKYLSMGGIVNIAGSLGEYNIYFTHGYGASSIYPIPNQLLRDMLSRVNQLRQSGVSIERVCSGHTHWLTSSIKFGSFYWDVTGGFQKWEKSVFQRQPGLLLYIYIGGEVSCIPIVPNEEVYTFELSDPGLEYKNLKYYGEFLLKHLKEVEKV